MSRLPRQFTHATSLLVPFRYRYYPLVISFLRPGAQVASRSLVIYVLVIVLLAIDLLEKLTAGHLDQIRSDSHDNSLKQGVTSAGTSRETRSMEGPSSPKDDTCQDHAPVSLLATKSHAIGSLATRLNAFDCATCRNG